MTDTADAANLMEPARPALGRRQAVQNLVAHGSALLIVFVATLLVARLAGPAVLGAYAMLRVLPWLTGVVVSSGLPMASAYFLAAGTRDDPRLRPTLALLAALGSGIGALLWLAATPLLQRFFVVVPLWLLALASITVITRLLTVWGKACCQGAADIRGANLVIVMEELMFLPWYAVALAAGLRGVTAVIAGLVCGGTCAALTALGRLLRTGFAHGWGRPSVKIARRVVHYGARGQLGDLLFLVNMRLDFVILGALAGPAVLGMYAVASKFAELIRLPAVAVRYVLYPRFARQGPRSASRDVRRLLPRAAAMTALLTPVLGGASVIALPLLFGPAFQAAVLPACILLIGLAAWGAAAVSTAFLCGIGRPGVNSWAMGIGVAVTVSLDVLLIPRHGAVGAAVASSAAYLVTTVLLSAFTVRLAARALRTPVDDPATDSS
ncbi:oligosaccharide flippase family protein [Streptomyces shaanxiensis]|uniref:O-antigen/teichoic acid export membrane protein n=1 Tax=Streptomyces shaanxiensis TaxID=653357 RepID=A0ABP7V3X5_9ACTN